MYHCYSFKSGIFWILSHGILLEIISIRLWVTLFLGVTYNTCKT